MFTSLANLADRRAKLVVIAAVVVTLVAGALGGGVADKLSSFGADDPATDSYKAAQRLAEATGLDANPGLIALVAPTARSTRRPAERRSTRSCAWCAPTPTSAASPPRSDGGGRELLVARRALDLRGRRRSGTTQGEDATERLRAEPRRGSTACRSAAARPRELEVERDRRRATSRAPS